MPQLEELVRSKVACGLYMSASEVVCEALRLLESRRCQKPAMESAHCVPMGQLWGQPEKPNRLRIQHPHDFTGGM